MEAEICGIIVALIAAQPEEQSLARAWLPPRVGVAGISPDLAEVARTYPLAKKRWKALFASDAVTLAPADCSDAFRQAGYKLAPWPKTRALNVPGDTSPDGNPDISFGPVVKSRNGKFARLAWLQHWSPEASGFRYVILEKKSAGWKIVGDASFGPVS